MNTDKPQTVKIPRHPDHSKGGTFRYTADGTLVSHELPTAKNDAEHAARQKAAAEQQAPAADQSQSARASKRAGSKE